MIKKAYRILCVALCMVILLSILAPTAFAAIPSTGDTLEPNRDTMIHPITGDQYSGRTFTTISAAKAAYGSCWVYQQTYEIYAGNVYNWYYLFSDGTKNFFYVMYDEDPIHSSPGSTFTE